MRTLKTYTFRVPDNLRRDLDSPAMRVWLADFLAQPRALPPDPGAGEDRVSLTLPTQLVAAVARILRCSSSSALRRVAVDRSGAPAKAATTERDSSETWQRKPEARATVRNSRTPMPPQTPAKVANPPAKEARPRQMQRPAARR